MTEIIRHVKMDEWDVFMRFLEKSYEKPQGFFEKIMLMYTVLRAET